MALKIKKKQGTDSNSLKAGISTSPVTLSNLKNITDSSLVDHPLLQAVVDDFNSKAANHQFSPLVFLVEEGPTSGAYTYTVRTEQEKTKQILELHSILYPGLIVDPFGQVISAVSHMIAKLRDNLKQYTNAALVDAFKEAEAPAVTPAQGEPLFVGLSLNQFPDEVAKTDPCPLSEACGLAQPTSSTSSSSIYHTIYIGVNVNVSARLASDKGTLSLRCERREGADESLHKSLLEALFDFGFDTKSTYWSCHFHHVTLAVANRTLAALVSVLGSTELIQPPVPKVQVILGKGS